MTPAAATGPASWLLDGRTGWRTAVHPGVSVGPSLRLSAASAGQWSLGSPGGSLGGLALRPAWRPTGTATSTCSAAPDPPA